MSRIVNTESAGKERNRAQKVLVLAIRELLKQQEPGDLSRDLIACILMSLDTIFETVDLSVAAWEDRGYWLKADRFRQEWNWSKIIAEQIRPMVHGENYGDLIPVLVDLLRSLSLVKVSENHRMGTPWIGCWEALQNEKNGEL